DLDDLVVDALRDAPHPMHQTVEQALALIDKLKPRRAWFTHIAHDLAHAETNDRLRKLGLRHVQLAYDGLQFDVPVDAPEPRAARSGTMTSATTIALATTSVEAKQAAVLAFTSPEQ